MKKGLRLGAAVAAIAATLVVVAVATPPTRARSCR